MNRQRTTRSHGQGTGSALCRLGLVAVVMMLAGCTQVQPKAEYERTRQLVTESTGAGTVYDPEAPPLTDEKLDAILRDGLTMEEAVRVALLNNRRLQAEFASIGVAKAEWVQAGLLSNPTLGLALLFPEGGGLSNLQVNLAQNIVDLWQIPIRKRVAKLELEHTILRIARAAGELVNNTRRAYYHTLASAQLARLAQENLDVFTKSHDAIRARREAGAVAPLDENLARGELLQAQALLRDAQLQAATAKRELAKLMSVEVDLGDIRLGDDLPGSPIRPLNADELIALARDKRLDLQAVQQAAQASNEKIRLEYAKIFPEISIGPSLERPERRAMPGRTIGADFARASIAAGAPTLPEIQTPGQRRAEKREVIDTILGPSVNMTLPIFDQNQAQIARARFERTQMVKSYEDLYLGIAQDIRIAADRAGVSWSQVDFYRDELIPQALRNLRFAEASYRAGSTDIITLLQSQRASIQVRQAYVAVWSGAAIAWADLELAVGVPMAGDEAATSGSADTTQ